MTETLALVSARVMAACGGDHSSKAPTGFLSSTSSALQVKTIRAGRLPYKPLVRRKVCCVSAPPQKGIGRIPSAQALTTERQTCDRYAPLFAWSGASAHHFRILPYDRTLPDDRGGFCSGASGAVNGHTSVGVPEQMQSTDQSASRR
jgi:hypothetical protein